MAASRRSTRRTGAYLSLQMQMTGRMIGRNAFCFLLADRDEDGVVDAAVAEPTPWPSSSSSSSSSSPPPPLLLLPFTGLLASPSPSLSFWGCLGSMRIILSKKSSGFFSPFLLSSPSISSRMMQFGFRLPPLTV